MSRCRPGQGGLLVVRKPWPSMARTIYGDPERYQKTYWSEVPGSYFTGDGARQDADGYYWLMGRVDDVINVSGHRLGTMEVESALVAHPKVAEAAVVGRPDELKGQAICGVCDAGEGNQPSEELKQELREWVAKEIGSLARPDDMRFTQMPAEDAVGEDHAAAAAGAGDDRRDEGGYDDAGGLCGAGEAEGVGRVRVRRRRLCSPMPTAAGRSRLHFHIWDL